jgi:hypothetical protein
MAIDLLSLLREAEYEILRYVADDSVSEADAERSWTILTNERILSIRQRLPRWTTFLVPQAPPSYERSLQEVERARVLPNGRRGFWVTVNVPPNGWGGFEHYNFNDGATAHRWADAIEGAANALRAKAPPRTG